MRYIALLFCLLSMSLRAQDLPYAFGSISMDDLRMKVYEPDSGASAVKLLRYGHSYFNEGTNQIKLVIHERVKVLTPEGLSFGNLFLAFPNRIRVGKLRASVYNLDENGEMVVTKVKTRKILKERTDERKRSLKVVFPDVKVGSIIEYSFEVNTRLSSTFYPWYFQEFIPVRYSEFFIEYPDFARYKVKVVSEGFMDYISPPSIKEQRFTARNLPAIKIEPYVGNLNDYRCAVYFEVSSTSEFRIAGEEQFMADWSGVNRDLLFNISFGQRLNDTKPLANYLPDLEGLSDKEKIEKIRNTVMDRMTWDGTRGLAVLEPLVEVWKERERASQDINMLFIGLLREAGFDADPVAISTRDNGNPDPANAFINQFNYVIVHVALEDEEELLLDAAYENYPMGSLPSQLINKIGLLIDYDVPRWVDLNLNGEREETIVSTKLAFDEDFNITGQFTIIEGGLTAVQSRRSLGAMSNEDLLSYYRKQFSSLNINSVVLEDLDSPDKRLKIRISFERESEQGPEKDLFFNPLIFKEIIDNPFKADQRFTPVDYEVPLVRRWIYTLKLPESVKIRALPEPVALLLPDGEGLFIYNIAAEEEGIKVLVKYSLEKTFFTVQEYPKLRTFFQEVASVQQALGHLVR